MTEIEKLENELFCLNFEMKTLSSIVLEGQLERWVPGFSHAHTDREHRARYEWVADYVKGKRVMDIACGSGLGSYLLATIGEAQEVHGIDIDADAIRYASIRRQNPNLLFDVANAEQIEVKSCFDIIVSFETIEHLQNPESYLLHVKRSLKKEGELIISTPISSKTNNEHPDNTYHVREWGFCQFQDLISNYFIISEIYVQLYPPRKSIFEKILSTFSKTSIPLVIQKPVLWAPSEVRVDQLGTDRTGYQIIRCRQQ